MARRQKIVIVQRFRKATTGGVRLHHDGPQDAKLKAEVVANILADIKERRP